MYIPAVLQALLIPEDADSASRCILEEAIKAAEDVTHETGTEDGSVEAIIATYTRAVNVAVRGLVRRQTRTVREKNAQLTEGEEAVLRHDLRPSDLVQGYHSPNDPMSDLLRRMLETIDVLRSRPVITNCEDCAYQQYARCDHVEGPNPSPVFTEKMAKSVPPVWCPLRGAK